MGVELSAECDLLRLRRARDEREGERQRLRCLRCRGAIPGCKRADAKYCSTHCKRAYRWEKRNELADEIRRAARQSKVVPVCACGAELDTRHRPGPVPVVCTRCYMREAMRKWRAKRKACA